MNQSDLFAYANHIAGERVRSRTLVVALGGFIDAGHAQELFIDHVRHSLTFHRLGSFDADQLLDYRENRPMIVFDRDHFADYGEPEFALDQFLDDGGETFLLLTGPEPALRWNQLAEAVTRIVTDHGVELVVFVDAFPLPTPHTRPVLVTKHASDPALIPGNRPLFGQMLMGAQFAAMLETRLAEAGYDVVGLSAHVPQYLGDTEFPDAAIALVQGVSDHTGLRIPTEALREAAVGVRAQIDTQIQESAELSQVVHAMEEQYDEAMSQRELEAGPQPDLPDADKIGEEAEAFLRDMGDDGPGAAES